MGVVETIFGGSPVDIVRDAFITTATQYVPLRLFLSPLVPTYNTQTYALGTMTIAGFNAVVPPTYQLAASDEEQSATITTVTLGGGAVYRVEKVQNTFYFTDYYGDVFLLTSDEPILLFEFARNPRECSIRGPRKLNTKIITEAAIFFQFWGNDTYEINMSGNFGAMLPQNLFLPPENTAAYKAFTELRARFEDDHKNVDGILDYLVSLQFRDDIYSGVLQDFNFTLHQDKPYQIEYSLTMEALVRDTDDKSLSSGLSRRTIVANPHALPDTTQQLNAVEYEFPLELP